MQTLVLCLLCATAVAASEMTVAVVPVEARGGALSAADAAAVTAAIRAAAKEAIAPHGYAVVDAPAVAPALQAGAAAALFGRAAQMEGATIVAVGLYLPGSNAPAGVARVVGIGVDQLRADAQKKVPPLIAKALGLAVATTEPPQRPGTLRMPGGTAPPPPAPPTPAGPDAALVTLIREVTADVEQLRNLHRKQNLKVEILDDTLFAKALHDKAAKELTPAVVAAERARWTAFALAPPDLDPGQILLGVLDEQVAGFYDPFSKQLVVRKDPPAAAGMGADGVRLILAHEIEHALQDQNFGIPDPAKLPDDDVRLARVALLEGDAMAVMNAYGARRAHRPIKAAILGGAAMLRAVSTETLLRLGGKSPALLNAPAILREELVLPYAAGYGLVAEVYRRGGWALVDRMFQKPPMSSHQILHPEAYFAGEEPVAVPFPAAPAGTRVVTTGRMGELGARVAMEVCVEKPVVKDFVPRWEGDAYTIVEGANHALSLLWTSAWSADGAARILNLLTLEQPCWEESATPRMLAASKLATAGHLVAVARGSVDLDAAVARQLTTHVAAARAVPPLGDVPPPPPQPLASVAAGEFASPRLALHGTVPEDYEQDTSNAGAELTLQRKNAGSASLSLVPEPLQGESLDAWFQGASAEIATAQKAHLSFLGNGTPKLAGAPAEERVWTLEGETQSKLRIEVAPFCDGKASLTLVRIETAAGAREALEKFAASIQRSGAAPACADLE